MSKVVFIKGSVEVLRIGGKEYVRIYVYSNEGGRELARYADRGMTPSPPFWVGFFTVGVLVVTPSLGVNGLTPLLVTM
jgi:hypothetical protein